MRPNEAERIAGHFNVETSGSLPVGIVISPEGIDSEWQQQNIQENTEHDGSYFGHGETTEPARLGPTRLPCTTSPDSGALSVEPQGYVHILPRGPKGEGVFTLPPGLGPGGPGPGGSRSGGAGPGSPGPGWTGPQGTGPGWTGPQGTGPGWTGAAEGPAGEEYPPGSVVMDMTHGEGLPNAIPEDEFVELSKKYKNDEGNFLAMTAYGAVPLPEQLLKSIPEKLVSRPLLREREIFVLKTEERERVAERDFTQYHHKFEDVPARLDAAYVNMREDVRIIEVPLFEYKPVIEDKITEIPMGIKYVEVPIEVECRMPPRLVPVPKPHVVERVIEQSKPVVQEKVVEVPEVVRTRVPKVIVREIPFVVPRYVEKIVEVEWSPGSELPPPRGAPLQVVPRPPPIDQLRQWPGFQAPGAAPPPSDLSLPQAAEPFGGPTQPYGGPPAAPFGSPPYGGQQSYGTIPLGAPSPFQQQPYGTIPLGTIPLGAPAPLQQQPYGTIPLGAPPPLQQQPFYAPPAQQPDGAPPSDRQGPPASAEDVEVQGDALIVNRLDEPQTFYMTQGVRHVKLPHEAKIEVSIVQEEDVPAGVPVAQPNVRYAAPGSRAMAYVGANAAANPPLSPRVDGMPTEVFAGPMDPVVQHAPPGMRATSYQVRNAGPEILTKNGARRFKDCDRYLPIVAGQPVTLAGHPAVPRNPNCEADLAKLAAMHLAYEQRMAKLPHGANFRIGR